MAEHHWNKLQKRLKNIIDPRLNISFNNSPARKNTSWGEVAIRFFQVKLDKEIIWKFPKDTKQKKDANFVYGQYRISKREWGTLEFPIMSIIAYLDLPKDKLLDYEDKAGLAEIIKVCDKRIGYNRLRNLKLSETGRRFLRKGLNVKKNERKNFK